MKQKIVQLPVGGVAGAFFTANTQTAEQQLVPVAGPTSVMIWVESGTATYTIVFEGSHDGANWIELHAGLSAPAGFEVNSPWPYIRARTTAWSGTGEIGASICHLFE